ncbi:dyp-type peroxidase family protein [Talaromyces proteolyticus]|uniref:Dyp-type peroxidase family protein n=1 Tax=Talaromyces proteolyticus TaxID=1131652 RepID=A0AAD4KFD1_9EURO|nr:dyp-type peroxidase family protein [Talaromyces proteolyticus]KAH8689858.1 dyp-type peroxidase family protein [Talaromyces proteolyticus]
MAVESIPKDNIQGDIWPGLPKKYETFYFFQINKDKGPEENYEAFKGHLQELIPSITTAQQALEARENIKQHKGKVTVWEEEPCHLPVAHSNISFAERGLVKLGKKGIKDISFVQGMYADLTAESRDETGDYKQPYTSADGVFLVAGTGQNVVKAKVIQIEALFGDSITRLFTESGHPRPGHNSGREHFGFRDLISQPLIEGLDNPPTGEKEPKLVLPGKIFIDREGRAAPQDGAPWAKDGSFMVFRKLRQYVPEFDRFCKEKGPEYHMSADELGARMFGRWKSGCPIDLSPDKDDESLASCNNFDFKPINTQDKCPFTAHIRKTRPRGDKKEDESPILRRGLPYGVEVEDNELLKQQTEQDRGLLFVCYQGSIVNSFLKIQKRWCNMRTFPPGKYSATNNEEPGLDPIIGQPGPNIVSDMSIVDGKKQTVRLPLERWVFNQGGEYFFSPSISALRLFSGLEE